MCKRSILFLLLLTSILCVFRRKKNYNPQKLQECMGKINLKLNPNMKELLNLYNRARTYLLDKKLMKLYPETNENIKQALYKCFEEFGIFNEFVGCTLNCLDKCEDEEDSKKESCKDRCKKLLC